MAQGQHDRKVPGVAVALDGSYKAIDLALLQPTGARGEEATPLTFSVASSLARPMALAQPKKRLSAARRRFTVADQ